jgi:hypothetical protein
LKFNNDGTKAFCTDGTSGIIEFSLNNPYDITNVTQQSSLSTDVQGFNFSFDGSVLLVGVNPGVLSTFNLSTNFDLSTAPNNPNSTTTLSNRDRPDGVAFSTSGDRVFTTDNNTNTLEERTLPNAFDLTNISGVTTSKSIGSGFNGLEIDNDQSSLYVFESANSLKQFDA